MGRRGNRDLLAAREEFWRSLSRRKLFVEFERIVGTVSYVSRIAKSDKLRIICNDYCKDQVFFFFFAWNFFFFFLLSSFCEESIWRNGKLETISIR